jgi:hypothetical protein
MMKPHLILAGILLTLAGCGRGAEADLQYIKQARSIAAEWAMVNELDAQHKLTRTYVDSMHAWLADGLDSAVTALSQPQSDYGAEMKDLLAAPPGTPADELRAHSERLKAIEDRLESA